MEEALTALLLSDAGLEALVAKRVTWLLRPQGSDLPAIGLQVVSGSPEGSDEGDSGLVYTRVQFDCWAADALAAKRVAREVKRLLSGKSAQQGNVDFQGFFLEDERESVDPAAAAALPKKTSLDFSIWHTQ